MVFVYGGGLLHMGAVALRVTGKYTILLIIESICGLIVALSNMLIILTIFVGWRRLFKNPFYIILANLLICTSLKAFVELAFIVPYYLMQSDGIRRMFNYFTQEYELVIFNVSVLADYGVLFFSLLIALNRFVVVTSVRSERKQRTKLALVCVLTWLCSLTIPLFFFFFKCQYFYDRVNKVYINQCANLGKMGEDGTLNMLLNCLIYVSYACAILVLAVYLLIFHSIRRQRLAMHNALRKSATHSAEMRLLKHSVVVFALYAASILSVFAMTYAKPGEIIGAFDIVYVENLLNLSIAAVYPICFLAMSGEMKSILVTKLMPRGSWMESSFHTSANSNNQVHFASALGWLLLARVGKKRQKSGATRFSMVFTYKYVESLNLGGVVLRGTGKYTALLILESVFGFVVALSNMLIILILLAGWRRLMKNNFYIILSNLMVCTSLKAFVELAFVMPYYVMQNEEFTKRYGYFTKPYELLIFNASELADYGVLFFSLLIAIDRLLVVLRFAVRSSSSAMRQRLWTALGCCITWLFSFTIPVFFYFFECQYKYNEGMKLYYNECNAGNIGSLKKTAFDCLIYSSYACAFIVVFLYLIIFRSIRLQRSAMQIVQRQSSTNNAEIRLLKHSVVVFALYAASILCIVALPFAFPPEIFGYFDMGYVENLLNLSIAAVYPICFLAMSGEMKSLLITKLMPRGSWMVSSTRQSAIDNIQTQRNDIA